MIRLLVTCLAGFACMISPQPADAPPAVPPATDIFLAPLPAANGTMTVGRPANITKSPGYDNQPSFTPDGHAILFVSVRGGGTLPDIYRYDLRQETISRVTETPEGEYSPVITPDGRHISAVRIEADRTQRLWRFDLDGGHPEVVLAGIKPVGYYAWADEHTVALYVLGQPATLQLADIGTGRNEIVARGIGRSLQRIHGRGTISFVRAGADSTSWIEELDPKTRETRPLVRAVSGASEPYCAWTPDGTLLMAAGDVLYGWRHGDAAWTRVADLAGLGLHGITRLAVSPNGDRLAIVAEEK